MLPKVDFLGLNPTRLIIGANPFGGFSHQNAKRNAEMLAFNTVDKIVETWHLAEQAGINTMITNNETTHVIDALRKYLSGGGKLQWIAQVSWRMNHNMMQAIDDAIEIGCKAIYFHGALIDNLYLSRDEKSLIEWAGYVKRAGIPVGVAGHATETHYWVDSLDVVDFHAIPFFNCGSVHTDGGEKFELKDMPRAVECINAIKKPCIAYKILGAGRIDAKMAFNYAFESIKDTDVVNVGMYRGDNDNMVQNNAEMVCDILNNLK